LDDIIIEFTFLTRYEHNKKQKKITGMILIYIIDDDEKVV